MGKTDDKTKENFSQPFLKSTYHLLQDERLFHWPDLEDFFPENSKEVHEQFSDCDSINFFELTDGKGFDTLKEIVRNKACKNKLKEKQPDELAKRHHQETNEHFQLLSMLSVNDGLLSRLDDKEKILIRKLIELSLLYGKAYGWSEATAFAGDKIYSQRPQVTGRLKGAKGRELALNYLQPYFDENPSISISSLANILEVDNKKNLEKYGKIISESSRKRYARKVKKNTT